MGIQAGGAPELIQQWIEFAAGGLNEAAIVAALDSAECRAWKGAHMKLLQLASTAR
jgi:hypothetical protein